MADLLTDAAFRDVVEEAPDAIVLVDHEGRIAFVNVRTEELFGYERSEIIGQRVELLVPADQRSMHTIHREIYQERPEKRPMGSGLDLVGQRKDGSTFPVEISLSPSREVDGRLTVAVVRDVTRQRRAEEALRRSEERHRLLNERSESIIFRYRLTPVPSFEYISSAVQRALARAPEEFYVNPDLVFSLVHPDDRELLERTLDGQLNETMMRFRGPTGAMRWFEVSTTTVQSADGVSVALEGIARDVTERLIADDERLRLQSEVEIQYERNRLAGDLHDDTLQSIYALGLGLHAMRDDESLTREEVTDRTVEGLNEVIASLRAYMHRLSGHEDERSEGEPLASRIAALIDEESSTRWTVDADPEVVLDPGTERQIYLLGKELISNVQRHADASNARIALGYDDRGNLELSVEDDGVGFNRSAVGDGSFGLRSITLRADTVGADLNLDSAPGAGTRVHVRVPKQALEARAAEAADA